MSLRIGQLRTECRLPRRVADRAPVVERVARRMGSELAAFLGPSLAPQPAVVRVRQLRVRVRLPAAQLDEAALAAAWARGFASALFTALAVPDGAGPVEVFRAGSVAEFAAGAARLRLSGSAGPPWYYAEFADAWRAPRAEAAVAMLCRWPGETPDALAALDAGGALDALLLALDDLAAERLVRALAGPGDDRPAPLAPHDLVRAARLAARFPPPRRLPLRGRPYALRLHVQARRAGEAAPRPRALWHALAALDRLLAGGPVPGDPTGLPDAAFQALAALRAADEAGDRAIGAVRGALAAALEELRQAAALPPPAAAGEGSWIESPWAGALLLAGPLLRLGWPAAWAALPALQWPGATALLQGICARLAGAELPPARLDPALELLAGCHGHAERTAAAGFLARAGIEERTAALEAACPGADPAAAEGWEPLLDLLAAGLLRSFAERIRGFRRAGRDEVVRAFLRRPGRVRVSATRIALVLAPSPFAVALHLSGADEPVAAAPWLGGRRLEIALGGL